MKDFLIIGQGIAGSILGYKLLQKGFSVKILDQLSGATASRIATGIINPITGRRLVKSWLIDNLLSEAKNTYAALENVLNITCVQEFVNYKILNSVEQLNDIQIKFNDPNYSHYLRSAIIHLPNEIYKNKLGSIAIKNLLQIDTNTLLDGLKTFFYNKGILENTTFNFDQLNVNNNIIQYDNIKAKNIIFCDGYLSQNNPYFYYLPHKPVKGEALIIECVKLPRDRIVSGQCTITPWRNNTFYVGSSYDWKDKTLAPTEEKRKTLMEKLNATLAVPFTVVNHLAGMRPATLDRRPFIGTHPEKQNIHIFNGMGTKGISLVPYFAEQFANFIAKTEKLNTEVDIKRYETYSKK